MKKYIPDTLKKRTTIAAILSALIAIFGAPLPPLAPMVPVGVQLVCMVVTCEPEAAAVTQ